MSEIDCLHQLYIEDLTKIVNYGGGPRPRVRHPQKWEALDRVIYLKEDQVSLAGREVWVWSDLHFYHKNIIDFSDRPFLNVEEMNETLILSHNEYVEPDDISIWVGDVGFASETKINELLDRCNGYKILILGNHDFHRKKRPLKLNFDEIHLVYPIETPEVGLLLTHYPMDNIPYPWVNIHGHLHAYPNAVSGHPLHINVCCELHNYRPVNLQRLIQDAKMRLYHYE